MKRYINQLVQDIEQAIKRAPKPSEHYKGLDPENEEHKLDIEDLSSVEQYLHGEQHAMEKYFGIEQMYFPPVEKLSLGQIKELTNAFLQLWRAYHFDPVIPESVPDKIRYKLMRDYLKHETTFVTAGTIHIEFCEYEYANCPFPGHCSTCEEIENDYRIEEERKKHKNEKNYDDSTDIDLPF